MSHTPHSKWLIVLLGPTGVGKTDTAIALSGEWDAPILSSDSRQFFREMSIGTAAPTQEQLQAATHHFIGHKSITERYSCGMFELNALSLLDEYYKQGDVALLVGGSMLYIDAVCKGIDSFPPPDPELREDLEQELAANGLESLRAKLKLLDPEHYNRIDLKNPQRILKGVEVCLQTGKTYSSFLTTSCKERPFSVIKIGLNMPREELYQRINARVDQMMEKGLLSEAQKLYPYKDLIALKTVGYRELFSYLDGEIDLSKAVELIKRNTRRYAKRQLTWWGRDPEIKWFLPQEQSKITDYIQRKIR